MRLALVLVFAVGCSGVLALGCQPSSTATTDGPSGMSCRADCECAAATLAAGGPDCVDGHCGTRTSGPERGSYCQLYGADWPAGCACRVGACDERGCCVQADGTVASPDDAMCLPYSCRADCECTVALAGGDTCEGGMCVYRGRIPIGLCAPPGTEPGPRYCACVGGTCDDRQCCVLPDGTVATASDPACLTTDGGL